MLGCVQGAQGDGHLYQNTRAKNAHTAEKSDHTECPASHSQSETVMLTGAPRGAQCDVTASPPDGT